MSPITIHVVDDNDIARVPRLALAGDHQRRNAAAALAAIAPLGLAADPRSVLARVVHPGSGERATKYRHVADEVLGLDDASRALLGLLFLRGPQTAPELRMRSDRLHPFATAGDDQPERVGKRGFHAAHGELQEHLRRDDIRVSAGLADYARCRSPLNDG